MDAILEQRLAALERENRFWRRLACAMVLVGLVLVLPRAGVSQTAGATLAERVQALETKVANLQNRLAHVSRSGNNLYITGANLHLRSGLKATNGSPQNPQSNDSEVTRTNGLGNLIIGYNELRGNGVDVRTGSHNLVVGPYHNFQSYGAAVVGFWNTSAAPYASVNAGRNNTAGAIYASVSAGTDNTASGSRASVSGGSFNSATGQDASVHGGSGNTANGLYASISGGNGHVASGNYSSVSGGWRNTAAGNFSSVSGGHDLFVTPQFWWAAGSPGGSQASAGGFIATSP